MARGFLVLVGSAVLTWAAATCRHRHDTSAAARPGLQQEPLEPGSGPPRQRHYRLASSLSSYSPGRVRRTPVLNNSRGGTEMWCRLRCVAVRSASHSRPASRLGLGIPHEYTIARLDARESAAPFRRPDWRAFSTGSRGSSGRGVRRPNSDAAHRLRERISVAGDCESILAIVAAEHGEFNARIAATACHRLAKLSQANRNGPRMADPRAGLLLSVATKVSASMNAQDVANSVWALATLGWQAEDGTMRAREGAAVRLAPSMIAQGVANTVWALATLE